MPKDSGKVFEEKVLKVIAESANERGGGTVMRVMSWVVDGKVMKPCIDKRDWWQTEAGDRRIGKAKGITGFDLLMILRKLDEIGAALQIPKADIQLALSEQPKESALEPATLAPARQPGEAF